MRAAGQAVRWTATFGVAAFLAGAGAAAAQPAGAARLPVLPQDASPLPVPDPAARTVDGSADLRAALDALAALPGEPGIVSAAGVTRDETPLLTLENPSAFDLSRPERRLVLVGGLAGDPRRRPASCSTRCGGSSPRRRRRSGRGGR